MGSPQGATIDNFFLAETETRLLQQQLNSAPKVYFRYVDEIFTIFNNKADSMKFLDRSNSQHTNLQFTIKKSTNALLFLNMELKYTIIICNRGFGKNRLIPVFFGISKQFAR